ncbi:hypothetical protein CKA32_001278 [Geitlerinema sp. FC II]|nr:hypothetical protein CKA32_001278 [Geitlerinema sp. FC II]
MNSCWKLAIYPGCVARPISVLWAVKCDRNFQKILQNSKVAVF